MTTRRRTTDASKKAAHRIRDRHPGPDRAAAPPDPAPAPATGTGQRALRAAGQLLDAQRALVKRSMRVLTPLSAFEDVFDQRVAAALLRLGWPAPGEVQALRAQVAELQRQPDAVGRKPKGRPPR